MLTRGGLDADASYMSMSGPHRWELMRHAFGVIACIALGWFGVARGMRIPLLDDATYGFHALGHLVTWFLPDAYQLMAGSILQVFVPLGLAGYFLLFQRDYLGVSLMLAWAGVSAHATGLYIADAPAQTIHLGFGHPGHDWAAALGPTGLDRMSAAGELGWLAQALGLICLLGGIGFATWGIARALMERMNVEQARAYLERMPVRKDDDEPYPRDGFSDEEWKADPTTGTWDPMGR